MQFVIIIILKGLNKISNNLLLLYLTEQSSSIKNCVWEITNTKVKKKFAEMVDNQQKRGGQQGDKVYGGDGREGKETQRGRGEGGRGIGKEIQCGIEEDGNGARRP